MTQLIYRFLSYSLTPFLWGYTKYRVFTGKEDKQRYQERFGLTKVQRPEGIVVWFHGVSVGESLSLLPLIHYLKRLYPTLSIVLTTGTTTAARLIESRLPEGTFHQYIPLDSPLWVERFLNKWRPHMGIFTESEIWPNILEKCFKKKIPVYLINARLTEKSFNNWKKVKSFINHALSYYKKILCQNDDIANRFKQLGYVDAEVMPNLKFASPPLLYNLNEAEQLFKHLGGRKVWVAASTHPGEEEIILKTHKALLKYHPDLLLILAPRHTKRRDDIIYQLKKNKLPFLLKSEKAYPLSKHSIFVFDTMGDLGLAYTLAPIAFVGGSLVDHIGGHNPIEPAQMGCAVLWGPYMKNAKDICDILRMSCFEINESTLFNVVNELLFNPEKAKEHGDFAKRLVLMQKNNLKHLMELFEMEIPLEKNESQSATQLAQ